MVGLGVFAVRAVVPGVVVDAAAVCVKCYRRIDRRVDRAVGHDGQFDRVGIAAGNAPPVGKYGIRFEHAGDRPVPLAS